MTPTAPPGPSVPAGGDGPDGGRQPGAPIYADERRSNLRHCGPCLVGWTADVDRCPECGEPCTQALRAEIDRLHTEGEVLREALDRAPTRVELHEGQVRVLRGNGSQVYPAPSSGPLIPTARLAQALGVSHPAGADEASLLAAAEGLRAERDRLPIASGDDQWKARQELEAQLLTAIARWETDSDRPDLDVPGSYVDRSLVRVVADAAVRWGVVRRAQLFADSARHAGAPGRDEAGGGAVEEFMRDTDEQAAFYAYMGAPPRANECGAMLFDIRSGANLVCVALRDHEGDHHSRSMSMVGSPEPVRWERRPGDGDTAQRAAVDFGREEGESR